MARSLLIIILYAIAGSAFALDSWEHKRLSDLAYHLAVEIHCPDNATDEMCSELRPETSIDVSKSGVLSKWCEENPRETVCNRLSRLYYPPPTTEYENSKLSKLCHRNHEDNPVCKDVKKLLDASSGADPVRYREQKHLLRWCHKNRSEQICLAIQRNLRAESQNMRAIISACFALNDPKKCKFNVLPPEERLASASFFDPLAREAKFDPEQDDGSNLSYGDVTKCVDYFLTPDKLMAGSESRLWYKTEDNQIASTSRTRSRQLYPGQREDLELSVKKRCAESNWNLEGARSGHVNHTHFQAELLIAQRSQHLLALSLHAIEKNRMAALTANAISDHYLHDSFAPGHITTWRSRLTDLAANAYHDARNRKGLYVKIDSTRFSEMMRIAGADSKLYDSVIALAQNDTKTSESKRVREYFLYADKINVDCKKQKFQCVDDDHDRNVGNEVNRIKSIRARLLGKLETLDGSTEWTYPQCDEKKCVLFRGDGDLWAVDQEEQRLLLVLFQVRSILDVLQSAPKGASETNQYTLTDSFKQNSWNWHALAEESTTPLARTLYPPPSYLEAKIGPISYQIAQATEDDSKYTHQYQFFDSVYGINIGIDNMTFGDQQNRKTVTLEKVMVGLANENQGSINFAAVVGVQRFFEPVSNGYGVTGRASLVFPQTETIFSLMLREMKIGSVESNKQWKPTYGLRFDQGFTSFATMFFQLTRDFAAQRDGSIKSGFSVGAGVQIAAPKCRIPLVKKMCD